MDARDVPYDNHLFAVPLGSTFLSDTGQKAAIGREGDALERCDRHGEHLEAPGVVVIPNPNDRILALLRRCNQVATLRDIKAADWCGVAEEEPRLLLSLDIHGYQGAARGEEHDLLISNARPLQVQALVRRVSNYVFKLHNWVLVELRVHLSLLSDEHTCLVWVGYIAMRARQASQVESTTACIVHPLITYLTPGTEAKHFIRRQKIIATVTTLRSKESIHLGLHSIVLGLLVDFFDLIAAACSREPLVGKQTVDLVLHAGFLLFCHVRASVLRGQSCLGCGLASSLLCKLSIGGTRSDISRQFEPGEVLGPSVDIERKFESQVRR